MTFKKILIIISIILFIIFYILIKFRNKINTLIKINNLTEADIDGFMNSYKIFNNSEMLNTLEDYNNNKEIQGYNVDNSELEKYYKVVNLLCSLGSVKKM